MLCGCVGESSDPNGSSKISPGCLLSACEVYRRRRLPWPHHRTCAGPGRGRTRDAWNDFRYLPRCVVEKSRAVAEETFHDQGMSPKNTRKYAHNGINGECYAGTGRGARVWERRWLVLSGVRQVTVAVSNALVGRTKVEGKGDAGLDFPFRKEALFRPSPPRQTVVQQQACVCSPFVLSINRLVLSSGVHNDLSSRRLDMSRWGFMEDAVIVLLASGRLDHHLGVS